MRTTLNLDDEVIEDLREYTGVRETNAIVRKALEEMRQREAGRRLARLRGAYPGLVAPPRRRFPPE
jgi:Bacterial antitoxin of type II TA system, VapB